MAVRTKIICTLGPASSCETVLRKMMLSGMDVVRLNFSHGTDDTRFNHIELIRRLNAKYHRRVRILGDLQGHRVRIGDLAAPVELKKGRVVRITRKKVKGSQDEIPFDYGGPMSSIKAGHEIFIDDGNIALKVIGRTRDSVKTRVITGGLLKAHKGVNIPEARLEFGRIGEKDVRDVAFCEKNGIDYIAQSFVRTASDVTEVRQLLKKGSTCRIVAKIESREGIKNIDGIIALSDGIMIARGDMGVSLPIYKIPLIQKMIIKKCNKAGKFVITATQMLESMTENLRPTRAEVTDVANAIIDGTDFVMLSGESAVGKHPVETVRMMNDIIKYTERYREA